MPDSPPHPPGTKDLHGAVNRREVQSLYLGKQRHTHQMAGEQYKIYLFQRENRCREKSRGQELEGWDPTATSVNLGQTCNVSEPGGFCLIRWFWTQPSLGSFAPHFSHSEPLTASRRPKQQPQLLVTRRIGAQAKSVFRTLSARAVPGCVEGELPLSF